MLKLKEIPKFLLGLFSGFGLVKVSNIGFNMMKDNSNESSYYTGLGLVIFSVLFVAITFYVLNDKLSEKEGDETN